MFSSATVGGVRLPPRPLYQAPAMGAGGPPPTRSEFETLRQEVAKLRKRVDNTGTYVPSSTTPRYWRPMQPEEKRAAHAAAHTQVGHALCPHGVEAPRYGNSAVCGVCQSPWDDGVRCSHCRTYRCVGPLYACLTCVGYVLCQECNNRDIHSEHGLLQVKHKQQHQEVKLPPAPSSDAPMAATSNEASAARAPTPLPGATPLDAATKGPVFRFGANPLPPPSSDAPMAACVPTPRPGDTPSKGPVFQFGAGPHSRKEAPPVRGVA